MSRMSRVYWGESKSRLTDKELAAVMTCCMAMSCGWAAPQVFVWPHRCPKVSVAQLMCAAPLFLYRYLHAFDCLFECVWHERRLHNRSDFLRAREQGIFKLVLFGEGGSRASPHSLGGWIVQQPSPLERRSIRYPDLLVLVKSRSQGCVHLTCQFCYNLSFSTWIMHLHCTIPLTLTPASANFCAVQYLSINGGIFNQCSARPLAYEQNSINITLYNDVSGFLRPLLSTLPFFCSLCCCLRGLCEVGHEQHGPGWCQQRHVQPVGRALARGENPDIIISAEKKLFCEWENFAFSASNQLS